MIWSLWLSHHSSPIIIITVIGIRYSMGSGQIPHWNPKFHGISQFFFIYPNHRSIKSRKSSQNYIFIVIWSFLVFGSIGNGKFEDVTSFFTGALEHLDYISHILGIIVPTDFHIFQRGRFNHQPDSNLIHLPMKP